MDKVLKQRDIGSQPILAVIGLEQRSISMGLSKAGVPETNKDMGDEEQASLCV